MIENFLTPGDLGDMFDREQKKISTAPLSEANEPSTELPVSPEPGSDETRETEG